MFQKMLANLLVRKALVFSGALAVALVVMSGVFANRYDETEIRGLLEPAPVSSSQEPDAVELAPVIQNYVPAQGGGSVWDLAMPVAAAETPDKTVSLADFQPRDEAENGERDRDIPLAGSGQRTEKQDRPGFVYSEHIPLSKELQEYTYEQCALNDLDYELVLALMWRESRFQLQAVNVNRNGTTDSGVMQINDVNRKWLAKEMGITDLMDPKQNIAAGTAILGRFTAKYGEHNALMAYQYGEKGMERKLSQGVTTNKQIQIVYNKRADFEALLTQV